MDHAGRPRATDAPAILDALDVVVWQADARTTEFTFVSDGAARLLGWTPEEANAGAGRSPPGCTPTTARRSWRRSSPPRPATRSTSRIVSSLGTAAFAGCTPWAGSCMNPSPGSPA